MDTTENKLLNETQIRVLFKCLFEDSPISIWEEDFSAVYKYLKTLREQGITDLRDYFSKNPDQIDKCSRLVKILNINQASLKMYNANSREELLTDLEVVFTEDSKEAFVDQLILIANGGTHYEGENINKTIDGKTLDIFLTWTVAEEHLIDYSVVFVSLIDITDMKNAERALEETKERLNSFINSATDAFLLWDSNLNLIEINDVALTVFPKGTEKKNLIGKNIIQISPGIKATGRYDIYKKILSTGESYFAADTIPSEVFGNRHIDLKAFKTGDGLGIIVTDVTERNKVEEENKRQREQIKLINKILRHDLTNNLAAISSAINIFKHEKDDMVLETIVTDIEKSADLIMKMREHEFLVASTNLNIYDIGEEFEKILQNYQTIEYSINGKGKVFADDSLNSVIDNLVSNAVVHSGTERIDIQISSSNMTCEVIVIDYGKGIPDNLKMKIFDEGFKYGTTGHSGLGLHIVQKAVNNWGGEILIEDNIPKGSIFKILFKKVN